MPHIFPRHTHVQPPVIHSGQGCYLFDKSGKKYLDACGGAAVSCLGHSDEDVKQAIKQQVDQVAYAHTGFFTSEPAEQLADKLIAHAPEGLERVYLVSGGSEAVESALKLARQYYLEKGEVQRHNIIARRQSYHGNTLGALATGGNEWRRKQFAPMLIKTHHIAPCYAYRDQLEGESLFDYGQRVANELESKILHLGPETVMAFVAEPVVGATSGAVPAVEGYFKRIREICDHYGILLILDEVMCGMGRTGTLFACEQDGVAPDILCIAKGLGAGYQPIGAMLCSSEIYRAIEEGSGFFQHGHTYIGHPTAAAAALAVLTKLTDGLVDRVLPMGKKLEAALRNSFSDHEYIGDIRGRGLFWGIEMVQDKANKQPFASARSLAGKIKKAAFKAGLMCYPMSGTIDGLNGDHILLAPPFIIEDEHINEIVEILDVAFKEVLNDS
ncbi:aspartate aminotransferase family protein [Flexibacterium corallicola]|uniref:aspartate aminotransferase family protein n=1 Tax=Flexibacterium corallicola TaxID=3037259 RepID=UPI00286FAAEE|nr:aspartate aminotransferase family protein [Pseudovibrio sp. M1P-2-3]